MLRPSSHVFALQLKVNKKRAKFHFVAFWSLETRQIIPRPAHDMIEGSIILPDALRDYSLQLLLALKSKLYLFVGAVFDPDTVL